MSRPILAVDVDGVISLFGFEEPPDRKAARFELIDGMVHCISLDAGERLLRLGEHFELVWATGWEDKANDYLPTMLGLPELPHLTFDGAARFGSAHWKLGPLDEYGRGQAAGLDRRQLRRQLLRLGDATESIRPCSSRPNRTGDSRRPSRRAHSLGRRPLARRRAWNATHRRVSAHRRG